MFYCQFFDWKDIAYFNNFLSTAKFLGGLDVLNNLRSQIEAVYISGKTEYLVTGPQKFLASGIKCWKQNYLCDLLELYLHHAETLCFQNLSG